MDATSSKSHNLFQVFLRLRPPQVGATTADRFLDVEPPATDAASSSPTHIRLNPPNDRRRAIEKFGFTRVFEEDSTQLDVFHCTGVVPLVEGVLAPHGGDGTDALLATLGVTGSGKSHTILGSRSQRGLTQLSLDVVFRSIGENIVDCAASPLLETSIHASDASEATIFNAPAFLDSVYGDNTGSSRPSSRASTPMLVRPLFFSSDIPTSPSYPEHGCHKNDSGNNRISSLSGLPMPGKFPVSPSGQQQKLHSRLDSVRIVRREDYVVVPEETEDALLLELRMRQSSRRTVVAPKTPSRSNIPRPFMATTASAQQRSTSNAKPSSSLQGDHSHSVNSNASTGSARRLLLHRPSAFPQQPDVSAINVSSDPAAQYVVLMSMYEVYNDRIFDLLTPATKAAGSKEYRRRPLLFKSTELSPDRKVVAGLRKIVCSTLQQALMVLEAGLHERRVAGTGSNSVSSRSHGFVCVEVKKRTIGNANAPWSGSTLTVVDLAGSERARDAKTAGATLAEAGKINESLMYLGQCLQMQSDAGNSSKPNVVPFRQCKLTELLFSNSFPSATQPSTRRNPQRGVMVVTADPHGDYNATSQILRYSALAREITVPRIPSITQTIVSNGSAGPQTAAAAAAVASQDPRSYSPAMPTPPSSHMLNHQNHQNPQNSPNIQIHSNQQRQGFAPGTGPRTGTRAFSPMGGPAVAMSDERVTMEIAALEIARMAEEMDYLRALLEQETAGRLEADAHLLSAKDRMLELEQEVREDCAIEYEQRLALEMARWKASLEAEKERNEAHWDRKVEVMERLASAADEGGGCDHDDKENVLVENLEQENERLRRELLVMRRELTARSPSKRHPLRERDDLPISMTTTTTTNSSSSSATAAAVSLSTTPTGTPSGTPTGTPSAADELGLRRRMEQLRVVDDGDHRFDPRLDRGRNDRHNDASSVRSTKVAAVTRNGSPKKTRKMSPRKWDVALDEDDLF
ncbi:kinesin family protein [Grosmannia clavigera kw1407]|uniref:Kinesin-like protein n=1 Tax=Grosmannia clavigera (strain kw1407 / UAMH 11150) TaxID=655863 RepID=F0XP85_GROCL|nr:kinesin family protein [Grosmannia clavigera kw1407]EFX00181.1 kinesin family protein [Grosmannia clavigera kw1407]